MKLTSRLRVYKGNKLVKDRTTCFCGLVHEPPMTHDLHMALIEEFAKAQECDDCTYGGYSPHKTITPALIKWARDLTDTGMDV